MNYEESLARLEKEKEDYEGRSRGEKEEAKYELIKKVIAGYSKSYSGEVSGEKIDQVFSEVHGFTKQKENIKKILLLEKYIKAKKIKSSQRTKNLCFVGPPGTGKTHFSSKFAEALGRKFFKVELGGVGSAVIITGGKGIWMGSEPGKIINAIAETQSCDPVILLDEVDKTGEDNYHGTISNTLLHILDQEQNQKFTDQFLNVEIDISRIIFLLTANDLEKISEPLKNRLQVINLNEYNDSEKFEIGKITIKKIFEKNYEKHNQDLFQMKDEALHLLIGKVKEPGVRKLEEKINDIVGYCFAQWAQALERGEEEQKIVIDEEKVNEIVQDAEEPKKEDDEKEQLENENKELEKRNEELRKQNSKKVKSKDWSSVDLLWATGGGIVLTLFGCFCGWYLTKEFKKKKQSS